MLVLLLRSAWRRTLRYRCYPAEAGLHDLPRIIITAFPTLERHFDVEITAFRRAGPQRRRGRVPLPFGPGTGRSGHRVRRSRAGADEHGRFDKWNARRQALYDVADEIGRASCR